MWLVKRHVSVYRGKWHRALIAIPSDPDRSASDGPCRATHRRTHTSCIDGFVIVVPAGKQQQFIAHASAGFCRAAKADPDEKIVFSEMEWPSDGNRRIHAGFTPVVTLEQ